MDRKTMLQDARNLAYTAIEDNSALSDASYEKIKDDTNAVEALALTFLQEAADQIIEYRAAARGFVGRPVELKCRKIGK